MNETTANKEFETALQFINHTSASVFLTGKAGTGKTTFLKYIQQHSHKKMVVATPTGVAAINAGGVTIHSLFQIPPCTFLPTLRNSFDNSNDRILNKHSLLAQHKLSGRKKDLLQEIELLIIDEVSMVRADMIDAIDTILKHVRSKPALPFGGVQLLFIGDLYQLPPVVRNNEWTLLSEYYESPFFFDALALKEQTPVYIELSKIYRQSDNLFIDLLNNIRNNTASQNDIALLHTYYKPQFSPYADDGYITLSSHNYKADEINNNELDKLNGKAYKFSAEITGEFNETSYPVEETITLKEGAQIMFVKNDTGEDRQYYNGKLGVIKSITSEKLVVHFIKEGNDIELKKEIWRNIRYTYNKDSDEIEEEELGSFSQYPVRLAWAITIHKSQGLTFEKAIIDAGDSFAAGQVYVALSRLTNINGLVLKSKITNSSISTDHRIAKYTSKQSIENLDNILAMEKEAYLQTTVTNAFDFTKIKLHTIEISNTLPLRTMPLKDEAIDAANDWKIVLNNLYETQLKFEKQIQYLFFKKDYEKLAERILAAAPYFKDSLHKDISRSVIQLMDKLIAEKKTKGFTDELADYHKSISRKMEHLHLVTQLASSLNTNSETIAAKLAEMHKPVAIKQEDKNILPVKPKKQKGDSQRVSLDLFKEGKTLERIATLRNLAMSTIEGHLAEFVATGEINVLKILAPEKLDVILKAIAAEKENLTATNVKNKLGDEYTFGEIRIAMAYAKFTETEIEKL